MTQKHVGILQEIIIIRRQITEVQRMVQQEGDMAAVWESAENTVRYCRDSFCSLLTMLETPNTDKAAIIRTIKAETALLDGQLEKYRELREEHRTACESHREVLDELNDELTLAFRNLGDSDD